MTAVATLSTSRGSTGPGRAPSRSDWPESIINIKDKYSQGIVDPGGEADRLREEIAERLTALDRPGERSQRRQARLHRREVLQGPVP